MAGVAASRGLSVHDLTDHSDVRGSSFSVPPELLRWLGRLEDVSEMTLRAGHVRGNHYHRQRHELLIVRYTDRWSLHWDSGEGTARRRRDFAGAGGVVVAVPPLASHAIRNDGDELLHLTALADGPYDPDRPDVVRRVVVDH